MKLALRLDLGFGVWLVLFFTTWAFVLMPGEMDALKAVAGGWLITQAVGFGLQRLGVGIQEHRFWRFFADPLDGGIEHRGRRWTAWACYAVLDHFLLIQWPKGIPARGVVRSTSNEDRKSDSATATTTRLITYSAFIETVSMCTPNVDHALSEAIAAIYFADSSDYLSALRTIVKDLGGAELLALLESDPAGVYHSYAANR